MQSVVLTMISVRTADRSSGRWGQNNRVRTLSGGYITGDDIVASVLKGSSVIEVGRRVEVAEVIVRLGGVNGDAEISPESEMVVAHG